MFLGRRRVLRTAIAALGYSLAGHAASGAGLEYPTRSVRLVVGFPPGGATDIIGRLIGQRLSERLGQQFIVENRPGAGSNIATEIVARSTPDGYTLLLISGSNAYNIALYDHLAFDFIRDITPIASIGRIWAVLEVHPSLPVKSLPELVAYAKSRPGEIIMATAGIGSGPHLYGELFKRMAGVELVTVHYKGSGPALPDLVAGRVQVMFDLVASSIGLIREGKLRPLAVTSTHRLGILPEVPPVADFLPGYETKGWYGLGAPAGISAAVVERLSLDVQLTLSDPAFTGKLSELGVEPFLSSPSEFAKFIAEFAEYWDNVIRASGIKLD